MIQKTFLLQRTSDLVLAFKYDDLVVRNFSSLDLNQFYESKKKLVFKGNNRNPYPFNDVVFACPWNLFGKEAFIRGDWVFFKGSIVDCLSILEKQNISFLYFINKFGIKTKFDYNGFKEKISS